jgi:hypothetical protein
MSERVEFDREDVEMLRSVSCCPSHDEACAELADHIESLLPPRHQPESNHAATQRDHVSENRAALEAWENRERAQQEEHGR